MWFLLVSVRPNLTGWGMGSTEKDSCVKSNRRDNKSYVMF